MRDYDSDNSDSLNFSVQTIETFDTFEESICENSNQHETQAAQIFQKNSFGVEKQFESQVLEDHKECKQIESECIIKGQLISKCPFGVFKSPKKTMKFFPGFLP